jgi:hypothetical protein
MHRQTSLPETMRTSFVCGALALLGLACSEGRFPVCKSDAECQDAGKGNVCFDLRCVECRYDTDCKPGSVCGQAQTCSSIGSKVEAPAAGAAEGSPQDGEGPRDAGADAGPRLNAAGEPIGGDPAASTSGPDCAKRCADKACRDRCAKGVKRAPGTGK